MLGTVFLGIRFIMSKMNSWSIVAVNRLTGEKEEKAKHETHLRQLATMRPCVDSTEPKRFPHLKYRLKTRELQRDRANEIQLENRILLKKMLEIDGRYNSSLKIRLL